MRRNFCFYLIVSILLVFNISCNSNPSSSENKDPVVNTDYESSFGVVSATGKYTSTGARQSVHDPSIEYDASTGYWWVFGSHGAFAKSKNLANWSKPKTDVQVKTELKQVFAEPAKWAARGSSSYDLDGNLWAPDVIWNEDMKKWCMYMSVNGDKFYSVIALATSDNIDGPYKYEGPVVYSGFASAADLQLVDYTKVTGKDAVDSWYLSGGKWSGYNGTNAIDPTVLYDKDGQLWMVYGSWFGGLYVLKLDNNTGLRDYSYTYANDRDSSDGIASDEYLGKRVSGGFGGTGEGPYIVYSKETDYYYLYTSYDGLNCLDKFSGYHMRLFRSKNIDGPYLDAAGRNAVRASAGDAQYLKGIKIMGNYYLSSLSGANNGSNAKSGYMSPGHNSALIDEEGNAFLIYHTRFKAGFDASAEWHELRVHQQFFNEDGWPCTAPYEFLGSKISETGYASEDIIGTYDLVNHGNHSNPDKEIVGMLDLSQVVLKSDGTIQGSYEGTWEARPDSYYITMEIEDVTYKGVLFKQYDESSSRKEVMTFSMIGENNIALWGSKISDSEEDLANVVPKDKTITALNNENILTDGFSVSLWIEECSNDWNMLITTASGNIGMPCLHYKEDNDWKANKWQCENANNAGLLWNGMLNAGENAVGTDKYYLTVNIKVDSIEWYRNGVLTYYHNDDTQKDETFPTIGTYCTNILNEINSNGCIVNPNDSWALPDLNTIVLTDLYTDKALSAEEALALYNSMIE